jgi:hypothetical protein
LSALKTRITKSPITTRIVKAIQINENASMSVRANDKLPGITENNDVRIDISPNSFITKMKKSLFVISVRFSMEVNGPQLRNEGHFEAMSCRP